MRRNIRAGAIAASVRVLGVAARGRVFSCRDDETIPIESILDDADVLSIDVFDTAITRTVAQPDHLFWLLGHAHHLHPTTFREGRLRAEKDARRRSSRAGREEATLDEIYTVLREEGTSVPMEAELELDLVFSRPRPGIAGLYRAAKAAGKRVVFTSDTSLPRNAVARLLEQHGYEASDLFVSSELNATKRTGALYSQLLQAVGVAPNRVLHVGDTFLPDIVQAVRKGLRVVFVPRALDVLIARYGVGLEDVQDLAHSALLGLLASRLPFDLGYHVLGPLYASFGLSPGSDLAAVEPTLGALASLQQAHTAGAAEFLQDLAPFIARWPNFSIARGIGVASALALSKRYTGRRR